MPKRLIGRSDKADFPDLGLNDIDIKIDTGAYTSAIHCHNINVSDKSGVPTLSFALLDPTHADYDGLVYSFTTFRSKRVKSSNGSSESRYLIKTRIRLYDRNYPIELSLSERGEMRFPVLIGRRLLMKRFIVDPSAVNLSFTVKSSSQQLENHNE